VDDFDNARAQSAADRLFAGDAEHLWRIELPENPRVDLPAVDREQAIDKYNRLCGILSAGVPYTVQLIEERKSPA
jgi:hypothetical protein